MSWLAAAVWGGVGGSLAVVLELVRSVQVVRRLPNGKRIPLPSPTARSAYATGLVARVLLGAAVAVAGAASTPIGMIAAGVAAALLLERIAGLLRRVVKPRVLVAFHESTDVTPTLQAGAHTRCGRCRGNAGLAYPCKECGFDPPQQPGALPGTAVTGEHKSYYVPPEHHVFRNVSVEKKTWFSEVLFSLAPDANGHRISQESYSSSIDARPEGRVGYRERSARPQWRRAAP